MNRLNDSENEDLLETIEARMVSNAALGVVGGHRMNRARFLPFGLLRQNNALNNTDDEDDISNRSYNFMGDDDATFMD